MDAFNAARRIWRAVCGGGILDTEKEKEVLPMKRMFLSVLFFILALTTMAVACSGGRTRRASGCDACSIGCAACTACTVVSCLDDGY